MFPPDMHDRLWSMIYTLGISGALYQYFQAKNLIVPDDNKSWQDRLLMKLLDNIMTHTKFSIPNPQLDPDRKFESEICKVLSWDWEGHFMKQARSEYQKTGGKTK